MKYWYLVVGISLIVSIVNLWGYAQAYLLTPQDHTYLGTIHYYEDYFFYVNHFFQGAHGNWLTHNQYTSEPTPPSPIYWSNILFGKIGSILFLTPTQSYAASVWAASFLFLTLTYRYILFLMPDHPERAFRGFLYSTFATSFIHHVSTSGQSQWIPYILWRVPQFSFYRLGGVPHHITISILLLIITLSWFSLAERLSFRSGFLLILLVPLSACLQPLLTAMTICIGWISLIPMYGKRPASLLSAQAGILTFASLLGIFACGYMSRVVQTEPHIQSKLWEASQQTITTFLFFLLAIGPISILSLIGIIPTVFALSARRIFLLLMVLTSAVFFFSPLPQMMGISNVRILGSHLYPMLGFFAVSGVSWIAGMIAKRFPSYRPSHIEWTICMLFLIISLPSTIWDLSQKKVGDTRDTFPVVYLPNGIMDGFTQLSHMTPYESIVIANPDTSMDTMVPALSGHTTYSGHMLTTIHNDQKRAAAASLFHETISPNDIHIFLKEHHISYIFFTYLDGDASSFSERHPYLHTIYQTPSVTIWSVK